MQEKGIIEDEMVGWLHWLIDMSLSNGRWWRTRKPGMLQSTGSQNVRHDGATEWTTTMAYYRIRIQIKISWGEKHIKVKSGKILTMELPFFSSHRFSSVHFSRLVMSNSLRPHEQQHARPPCPSPTPGAHPNSCPLSQWCHPTISSSVVPFSSCPQSFPPSGSFQMSQLFVSGGQSFGISASTSVLPMNTQDWSPLGWNGWISLQSRGLSRVFSYSTVQKHQFFSTQLSSQSNSHIHTWLLEKP